MKDEKDYSEYMNITLYAILVVLLVVYNLFSFEKSVGDSMEPTLQSDNRSIYQMYITELNELLGTKVPSF